LARSLARGLALAYAATVLGFIVVTQFEAVYDQWNFLEALGYPRNDFEWALWQPGRTMLEGGDPYPNDIPRPEEAWWTTKGMTFYPPPAWLSTLPLAALPSLVASLVAQVLLAASALLTLRVLGVRDWRCYALWMTSAMVVFAIAFVNPHLVIVLLAAVLWRYRDTPWAAAAALSAALALKLVLAPLWIWLLVTRRFRAAIYTAVAAPLLLLGSWALIGFNGLRQYPDLLAYSDERWARRGTLIRGVLIQLGYAEFALLATALLAALLVGLAWRHRSNDLVGFTLVAAAALVVSPLGWIYYLGLLVVPLAISRPSYSPAWLVLPFFWIHWHYSPLDAASAERSMATIAVASLLLALVLSAHRSEAGSLQQDLRSLPSPSSA
jgi:Glycosyltransferase family 87